MDNSDFVKSMDKSAGQMLERLMANMSEACLRVETDAKKGCPVDMGTLRASIHSEVDREEKRIVGRIGSNLDYAPYVHNGTGIYAKDGTGRKTPWCYEVKAGKYKGLHWTRGQKPQPFLQDAVIKNKAAISRLLGGGQ